MNRTANQITYNHIAFLLLASFIEQDSEKKKVDDTSYRQSTNGETGVGAQLVKQPKTNSNTTNRIQMSPPSLSFASLFVGRKTLLHFVCLAPRKTRKPSTNIPICVKWLKISTLIRLF